MALGTLALTIVYVPLVDLTRLDPILRIISFILLGAVLLLVSIAYARRKHRPPAGPQGAGGPPAPADPQAADGTTMPPTGIVHHH